MNRYFVFLYIENDRLTQLIDYAIYLLNPTEKWPAHVTLAGPYSNRKDAPRDLEFKHRISVIGIGRFKSENQNTVFLRVEGKELSSVWDKSDYPYNPHLTLYDGNDADFSEKLFEWGKSERMIFSFLVSKRVVVSTTKKQGAFNLLERFKPELLSKTKNMNFNEIANLSSDTRLALAKDALKRAKNYALKH